MRTLNCPPTYSCWNNGTVIIPIDDEEEDPLQGYNGTVTAASCILYYGFFCFSSTSTDECRALQRNGCTTVVRTTSCPPEYYCLPEKVDTNRTSAPSFDPTTSTFPTAFPQTPPPTPEPSPSQQRGSTSAATSNAHGKCQSFTLFKVTSWAVALLWISFGF